MAKVTREVLVRGWVARLRSGDVVKVTGRLRDAGGGRCAMGVLCDVAEAFGLGSWEPAPYDKRQPLHFVGKSGHDGGTMIPIDVQQVLGDIGEVHYEGYPHMIWDLSDSVRYDLTFDQIADLVEAEYL